MLNKSRSETCTGTDQLINHLPVLQNATDRCTSLYSPVPIALHLFCLFCLSLTEWKDGNYRYRIFFNLLTRLSRSRSIFQRGSACTTSMSPFTSSESSSSRCLIFSST
eukprot:761408-Hanusia_phi.AAC.6